MIEVTNENYYSPEVEKEYMTYSQFKLFLECEAKALAIIEGRYERKSSDALIQGSYLDAHFSGEMDEFIKAHPEMFKKDGTLLAKYDVCENAIKAIEEDEFFHKQFFSGKPQQIVTGIIAGVPFKGKLDMLYEDYNVDMKLMKDVEDVWNAEERRKVPFWKQYGYDIQGAIYQELLRQNIAKRLPHHLAVVTKTDPVEKHAYRFSQGILDKALELVKSLAPRFQAIKNHEIEPNECGKCDYYHSTHKLDMFDIVEIVEE